MKPRLKGQKWEITYRIPGYTKPFSERFDSEQEANVRIAEIDLLRSRGILKPPTATQPKKYITLSEFLDEYVAEYGSSHWGDTYYSMTVHRINHYIKPFIGDYLLKDITSRDLDAFYNKLLSTKAIVVTNHKDTGKTISVDVIEKCGDILKCSLGQAVNWGYIQYNPALGATPPKHKTVLRDVWTVDEAMEALRSCESENMKVCMLLAIGCSMRLGEILGLQWPSVNVTPDTIEKGYSTIKVRQELKRCDKSTLAVLEEKHRSNVYYKFPETKEGCKTSLVLKAPKTDSSVRTVYVPKSVAEALLELKAHQEAHIKRARSAYQNFDMVIAQPDGRPVEHRIVEEAFKKLCQQAGVRVVVFHTLRNLSTSLKLQYSGGDIKAVQGDTGHAQSRMVTDTYARTFDESRRKMASAMETKFFDVLNERPLPDKTPQETLNEIIAMNPEYARVLLSLAQSMNKNDAL